jgi:hypothetical protein
VCVCFPVLNCNPLSKAREGPRKNLYSTDKELDGDPKKKEK